MEVHAVFPNKILMIDPQHFRVEYAINPHMNDASGKLNQIDSSQARKEWQTLKSTFESIGLDVIVHKSQKEFPDQVFCANPSFPFLSKTGKKNAILSNMTHRQRQKEPLLLQETLEDLGYKCLAFPSNLDFEGMGDAVFNYWKNEIYCGYGFRTSSQAPSILSETTGFPVHALELVSEDYYHLDTCFCLLGRDEAAYLPQAFSETSCKKLKSLFPTLIEIDTYEGKQLFAGNAFCPDGKNVILQKGSEKFVSALREIGKSVHEVSTTEFIKSGGSVFCMKLQLW